MSVVGKNNAINDEIVKGRCCVYLCCMASPDGRVIMKIGVSATPFKRLMALSTSLPFPHMMLYSICDNRGQAIDLESTLHFEFRDFRTRGEWFMFTEKHGAFFSHVVDSEYRRSTGRIAHWFMIDNTNSKNPHSVRSGEKSHSVVAGHIPNYWECAYCGAPKPNSYERYCDEICAQSDKIKPLTSDKIWSMICMLRENVA